MQRFIFEFDKIPVFIITAIEDAFPSADEPDPHFMWSSVYLAAQNLLLAARAMGLGADMTASHLWDEPAVRQHFGIPENFHLGATIPIGYPEGRYGPLTRNRRPRSSSAITGDAREADRQERDRHAERRRRRRRARRR
jgi:nitroreductase